MPAGCAVRGRNVELSLKNKNNVAQTGGIKLRLCATVPLPPLISYKAYNDKW
jgi:hypothetical protein